MRYLYGDSSISPFTSNFLEFLRDSIDFCVYVLEADQRIRAGRQRIDEVRKRSDVEIVEIEALGRAVTTTIETTPKGAAESPAADCATRMQAVCDETVRAAIAGVRARLANETAQTEAEESTERDGCLQALLMLLAPHVPPDASTVLGVRLDGAGAYEAVLAGTCDAIDLTWRRELEVPEHHPFQHVLRVEALQRRIELSAPDLTGWIKKQVSIRPQHLERNVISEAILKGSKLVLRLRHESDGEAGFDLESDSETGRVGAARLVSGPDQAAAGNFAVDDNDVPKVVALCETVRGHLDELRGTRAFEATFGDVSFQDLPNYVDVVERLVAYLAPMVHEIAKHSLEPDELVLRRQLADNRREEIFVSKTTLRDKYEHLAPELRALFTPLGLRASLSRSMMPAAQYGEPATRSELPPSNPPPPPAKPQLALPPLVSSPVVPPPPPTPTFSTSDGAPAPSKPAVVSPPAPPVSSKPVAPLAPRQAKAAAVAVPPVSAPAPARNTSEESRVTSPGLPPAADAPVAPATAPTAAAAAPAAAAAAPSAELPIGTRTLSKPNRVPTPDPQNKAEAMAGTLRKALERILELDGAERWPEAHTECARLLESPAFASYNPDDQRRVLKLLVVLETRATPSDARVRALRAARDRARALIERHGDPADYELLGLFQVALKESDAASETFRKGLELETSRNADSDLCGRLKRHAESA